ncbi:hypothetical protein CRUP_025887 [Coryphaenoides rupestris]|nr:hypothetical protein CRUP_025887 [Coryphaenoides rupestris]
MYSNLATIRSNTDVNNMIKLKLGPMSWIGLHDDPKNWKPPNNNERNSWRPYPRYTNWFSGEPSNRGGGELVAWMWSDRTTANYKRWEPGQPDNANMDQMCAASTSAGYWRDEDCALEYPFICYGAMKKKQIRMKVKIKTNADMAVTDNKAQILQKALLARGLTNISLSWVTEPQTPEPRTPGLT